MAKQLYVAYFTGAAGSSLAMFLIGDGVIAGADAGGMKYDGIMEYSQDGSIEGVVQFIAPAGTRLITGMLANTDQTLNAQVRLPLEFDDGRKITQIDTPAGPINARFERLREIP
jgi:hypothetical protein